jgi:hypothetical protein
MNSFVPQNRNLTNQLKPVKGACFHFHGEPIMYQSNHTVRKSHVQLDLVGTTYFPIKIRI